MHSSSISEALLFGALLASAVWLVRLSLKWRSVRASYKQLPCPPHSFWWGHLKVVGEAMKEIGPQAHPQVAMALMGEKYNLGHVFYVDLWPVATSFMVIQDPGVAAQIAQTHNIPKHELNKRFLRNLAGERSIVTAEGAEWKAIRSMLNPGFAPQYLTSAVPDIMKHIVVFRDRVSECARTGETILMQEFVAHATLDVIGEMLLGQSMNAQLAHSPIADNFRKAISWAGASMDLIGSLQSAIPQWWYCLQLDRAISKAIQERHATHRSNDNGKRVVVDLALQAYKEQKFGSVKPDHDTLDPDFLQLAVNNIKTLLLGGHDTTATALSYTLYLLSTSPASLATLRAEHDSIFTRDTSRAASLISASPPLLHHLPYTTACIREALRLFPPGSTIRGTSPTSIQSVTYNSTILPLTSAGIWISHYGIGRRADLWPDPLTFHPERFLPDHAAHGFPAPPPKDAFRPFEKGPRSCVGVDLAMLELKMMLVLVARDFDFHPAYAPDAPRAPDRFGAQHYQIVEFSPKPAQYMPMKVKRREVQSSHR